MNHFGGRPGAHSTDDLKGKIYDRKLYARMLHYLKPYIWMVVISFIILMCATFSEIVLPLIQRTAIDDYIVSDKTLLIFPDKAELKAFLGDYQVLKLKSYDTPSLSYVILSTKEINKIDAQELKNYRAQNQLCPVNIYLLQNTPGNRRILDKTLSQNPVGEIVDGDIEGWIKLSGDKILLTKTQ
ncbi:MAG: hypothetical protein PHI68_00900, partial [Candidatus Cloacimonetes bacterium]|nr:hypothetical protein [Candidatus Cloacimonadota bacterium]